MHPVLLKLGPLNVYSYGFMVALGFALATAFVYMRAPSFGIDRNNVVDLMILMLVAGIAGPFTGWLIDRHGPRAFYLLGIGLLGIAYLIYLVVGAVRSRR